jgi:demethylmenaquinone methyltransferase/2-methoxy-6-polyprenyl-1,4-benzoquinol methylase
MEKAPETFYLPGAQRQARVNDLFTRIAPRYDLINDLQSFGLHRYWKRCVILLAGPKPGMRALDLCCGTGDLAYALAGQGAQVVGIDLNQAMLHEAQRRSDPGVRPSPGAATSTHRPALKYSHASDELEFAAPVPGRTPPLPSRCAQADAPEKLKVQFLHADAQHIPFPDNTFDIVTVGYGLRNLADCEAGLLEMQRVAKPGGRIVSLDFGKPDNEMWRAIYFAYLRLFVPCLGRIFCGSASAYSYILESLQNYPAQHGVAGKMRELGLANVRIINLLGGVMGINYGEKGTKAPTSKIQAPEKSQ